MYENLHLWAWLTDHIPYGRADAVSADYLAKLFDIDKRELRRVIEDARRDNVLICGDNHGYYQPVSDNEIRAYVHRVRGRIRTASQCLAPFLREIKRAEGGGGL
jgi:hypothetical protein